MEESLLYVRLNQNSGEECPGMDKNDSDNINIWIYTAYALLIFDIPDIMSRSEVYPFYC